MKHRFIITFLVALSVLNLQTPRAAEAVWGIGDVTSVPDVSATTGAQVGTNATQSANSIKQIVKEYGLDTAAYSFSQAVATKMTNSIVNWVNGGFKGSPSFINDFQSYFKKTDQQQANYFLTDLQNMAGSNPLIGPVVRDIATVGRGGSLQDTMAFTLTQSVGQDWEGWANNFNNSQNDPWSGWLALTQPQNTGVGVQLLSARSLNDRIQTNAKAKEREILSGNGFFSKQVCVVPGPTKVAKQRRVKNPNYQIEYAIWEANGGMVMGGESMPPEYVDETYMEDIPKDKQECLQQKTNTPANAIQASLNKAIGTPVDRQTQATDYRQILTGALAQLTVALVNKGVQELKGEITGSNQSSLENQNPNDPNSLAFNANSTPTNFNWNDPTFAINDINSTGFIYNENNVKVQNTGNSGQMTPSWQLTDPVPGDADRQYRFNQIELGIYYGQKQIELDREAISIAQVIPQKLMTLDQCIPGPDYGYKTRIQNLIGAKSRDMVTKADKADGQIGLVMRGLELEGSLVTQTIASEMLDPKKNLPVAAEALAFIDGAESYQDTIEELRSSLNETQKNVTALVTLQNQWALATRNEDTAKLAELANTFRALDQGRATESSLNDHKGTLEKMRANFNRAEELYTICNDQRQNPAYASINLPGDGTYLNSGIKTERFNVVNADRALILFCPVDLYKVNEVARWIGGGSHSGYGGNGGLGVSLTNDSEAGIRCGSASNVQTVTPGDGCVAQELIVDENGNRTKRPAHPIDIITRHNPNLFNQYNPLQTLIYDDLASIADIEIDHAMNTLYMNPEKSGSSYHFNMVGFGVNCKDFYRSTLLDYTGLRSLY